MPIETLYHSLSARVIGGLIDQLLFFGVFAVALAITRRCTLDKGWSLSGDLIRHLLLLFSVTLFTLFIDLAYEVENFKGLYYQASDQANKVIDFQVNHLSDDDRRTAKLQLLVLMPVDMIGIALNSSLFALITIFLLDAKAWPGRNISTVREVIFLLIIVIAWHVAMIVWWALYGCFTLGVPGLERYAGDIAFHVVYIAVEFACVFALARTVRTKFGQQRSGILAWLSVSIFGAILLSLYAIRLWEYAERFFTLIAEGSA